MFDIRRWFAAPRKRRRERPDLEHALRTLEAGRAAEALDLLAAVVATGPPPETHALALNKRGVALIELGRRDEARAAFNDALAVVERYPPALVNLGNMLLENGALDEAIEHYRAALRSDEENVAAHLNLGVALKRAGRTSEGVRHLRTAQRLEGRRRF